MRCEIEEVRAIAQYRKQKHNVRIETIIVEKAILKNLISLL